MDRLIKQLLVSILLWLLLHHASGQTPTIPQLRRELARAQQDTVRIRLYSELISLYARFQKPSDSVYILAKQGLALARQYGLTTDESRLYLRLGYYYKRLGQYAEAQSALEKGLQIGQKTGITPLRCELLYRLSTVYGDRGMYPKTIETAYTSLQMAEQLNDSIQMCKAIQLLALANQDVKNGPVALSYARKFYQLARQMSVKRSEKQDFVLMAEETFAELYEANGQAAKAYPYLKRALNFYVAQQNTSQIAEAATRLANNLLKQKRPLEAIRLTNEFVRRKQLYATVSDTYEIYALAYQQLGQFGKALGFAQNAYKRALTHGHFKQIQSTLGTLISLEENQKQYPAALAHLRQLNTINDSLFTIQKSEAIAQVEAKYQVAQKEHTIELLQKDADLRQVTLAKNEEELALQQRNQQFLIVFAIILAGGIAGLYLIFRRERFVSRLLTSQKADIQEKAEQLDQLNQLKDKLFGIIGHDLRSPLAAVRTYFQSIAIPSGIATPEYNRQVGRLLQLVDSAYNTADNLLNWSLLQKKGIKVRPTEVDLADIAETVLTLYKPELQAKQLALETNLVSAMVHGDEYHLEIIARNILNNAIKFTPTGKRIYVSTQHEQGRGELVIEDAGIGLTTDYLTGWPSSAPRVGTSREKGAGLGLEICQELIRLNQGELHITSRPGEGTKVVISL